MKNSKGFTFIEILVVISIIGILVAIAVPNYRTSILKAKEAVLKENLFQIRDALGKYYLDKKKYPIDLEELVAARYLSKVPFDPMTNKAEWDLILFDPENIDEFGDNQLNGVVDVKSLSKEKCVDGTEYSEW
jgi:general secretion pathway protein G